MNLKNNDSMTIFKNQIKTNSLKRLSTKMIYDPSVNIDIEMKDLAIENLVRILKKAKRERNPYEIFVLMKWLETTDLFTKLKVDKFEEKSLENMIFYTSLSLEFQNFEHTKFVFYQGDYGDKFYIIMNGTIEILKKKKKLMKLNAEEYYLIIKEMSKKEESDLLNKTIAKNNHIFPVYNNQDINNFEEIFFKVKYRKSLLVQKTLDDLKKLFIEHKKNPLDYEIDLEKLQDSGQMENNNTYLKKCSALSNDENVINYRNVENINDRKNVTIYEHYLFLTLTKGNFFGHMALDSTKKTRTATVRALAGCKLCFVQSETYNNYILKEREKMKTKELLFLINNFFFQTINISYFEKKFFPHYIAMTLHKKNLVYDQNQELNKVYFIKSGEIELNFNGSLLDIFDLLKTFPIKNFPSLNISETSKDPLFQEEINRKRMIKVLVLGSKQVMGLLEYKLNQNSIFSARVFSDQTKIYSLENKMFTKFIKEELSHKSSLESVFVNELQFLVERICSVYNDYISLITKKSLKVEQPYIKKKYILSYNTSCIPISSFSDNRSNENSNISPISKSISSIKFNQNGVEAFNNYYSIEKKHNLKKEIFKRSGILKDKEFNKENKLIKEIKSSILNLQSHFTIVNEKSISGKSINDSYNNDTVISHVDLGEKLEDNNNELNKEKLELLKKIKNISYNTLSKLFRVDEEKQWLNNNIIQNKDKVIRKSVITLDLPIISPKITIRNKTKTIFLPKKFISQK